MMPGEGERWTIYLDERAGEPWWRVRWPGNGPGDGAQGFRVVEVVPASRLEAAESELEAWRLAGLKGNRKIAELESALTEARAQIGLREAAARIRSQIEGSNDG